MVVVSIFWCPRSSCTARRSRSTQRAARLCKGSPSTEAHSGTARKATCAPAIQRYDRCAPAAGALACDRWREHL